MPKHITSFVSTLPTTLFAGLIALGMTSPAPAGDGCIERPNHQPNDGAHWYYQFDHATHRKCWHLGKAGTTVSEAEVPAEQSGSAPVPIFSSLLSALFAGITGTANTVAPDAKIREPRIIQPDPTKILKVDDIVQKRPSIPEESVDQRALPRLNRARHDALFHEFLQWEEARRNAGGGTPTQSP
jgi:hypothetical protein